MAVPDISHKVECAFGYGWRDADASRVWVDVSEFVEFDRGMTTDLGRKDERSTADANSLTLTFDNSDGRFSAGRVASPYYPNIKVGVPIRVTSTIGGVSRTTFNGYVNEWPVEWPGGSDAFSLVTVTASSAMSRLGTTAPLVNPIDAAVDEVGAVYYWPLSESTSANKGVEAKGRADAITIRTTGLVVPGVDDLGLDGRTGWKFTGSGPNAGTASVSFPIVGGFSMSFFAKVLNPAPDAGNFASGGFATGGVFLSFLGRNTLDVAIGEPDLGDLFNDGDLHHWAVSVSPLGSLSGRIRVYRDGVLVFTSSPRDARQITGFEFRQPVSANGLAQRDLAIGRVSVYPFAFFLSEVETLAATKTLYSGDSVLARLDRIADWASIPFDLTDFEDGRIALGPTPADGGQALELMRRVETSDGGVLFDARDGVLTYRSIRSRYTASTALAVDMSSQRVRPDYSPRLDRSALVNVAKVRNSAGTVESSFTDEESRTAYGDAAYDAETDATNADEPLALASWTVNANAEPIPRVASVTLNVVQWIGDPDLSALLNLEPGSRVEFFNTLDQDADDNPAFFVEGVSESMSPGVWDMTLNLSPAAPYDAVLVLDSTTRGLLDTNTLGL